MSNVKTDESARFNGAFEKMLGIMNSIDSGITVSSIEDGRLRTLFANDEFYSMLGFTPHTLKLDGERLIALIHPSDRERVVAAAKALVIPGSACTLEYRAIRADGKVILIRNNISVLTIDGEGTPLQVDIYTDISHEKSAHDKLRELNDSLEHERKNLRDMMNDTPGGFARLRVFDASHAQTQYVNDGLCAMRGMTREQLLEAEKKDAFALVYESDEPKVREAMREMTVSGETRCVECRLRCGSGSYEWFVIFGRYSLNTLGEAFINAYYADVPRAERQELSLRETIPSILGAIMESTTDLCFAKDRELNYICCSRAFAGMVGLSDENEVVGKTDFDLFTRDTAEKFRADDMRVFSTGSSIIDKVESIHTQDGVPRFSSTSKYLLRDTAGNTIGLYGVGRDITEYRNAFEQLKLLTDSIPGGLAMFELTGDGIRSVYFSEGFFRFSGYTREEYSALEKNDPLVLIEHEDRKNVLAALNELRANPERTVELSCRCRTKDGELRWLNMQASASELTADKRIINVVLLDVTSERLALLEMQISNQLVDDSSSSVYVCDAKSCELLYVNRRAAELVGSTPQLAKGQKCYRFFKGLNKKCERCYMDYANDVDYTAVEYSSEQTNRHFMTRGKFIDWGGSRAFVQYLSDITERVETQRRLRNLLDGIPAGVGIFDYYDDGRLEMVYLNNGYYQLVGSAREEHNDFEGMPVLEYINSSDIRHMFDELREALKNERTAGADIRVKTGSGQYMWVGARASVAYVTDEKTVLYVTFSDIDREKKDKLRLEASKRIVELANQVGGISLWLYNLETHRISHDMENDSYSKMPSVVENVPYCYFGTGEIAPESEAEFMRMYTELFEGAQRCECVVRLREPSGSQYVWQRIVYTRLHDSFFDGSYAIGLSTSVQLAHDMQMRYEHELLLRHEMVKDSLVYYELNLNTDVIEEYRSLTDDVSGMKTGALATEELCESILANVVPEDRERIRSTMFAPALREAYLSNKTDVELVYRRVVGNKGVRYVKTTANIIKRPGTDDLIAFLYMRDVDKQIKEQLALDSVIDEEIEGVVLLNVKTETLHPVKSHNDFDSEEFTAGMDHVTSLALLQKMSILSEDLPGYERFLSLENLVSVLDREQTAMYTYRRRDKHGNIIRKRTLAFYLDETHEDIVLSRRDITTLYLEEQRQKLALQSAVDAANEANRAKSDFLSRMSHDMRTPMNAIIGMVELARDESNPPRTLEYLDDIDASSHFLLGLINDILDLSRIENGSILLHNELFTTDEFKRGINTVIRPLMDEKNIKFTFDMHSQANIIVDKLRFTQIFFNLLSNAAKYTKPGGHVEFECTHIPDRDGRHGMRLIVCDNGVGMSEEFQKRMFDPFSREHSESRTDVQGSGLGLAIVKNLVDAMGGTISVKSEPGKGSEFTVELYAKLASADVPHAAGEKSDLSVLNSLQVLLVEDNALNVMVAQRLLERHGCIVDVAANGRLALEAFESSPPDFYGVVLMDVRMPIMDGLEATRRIRALGRPDAASVPIIAMTADAFSVDADKTLESGMNAHISKPIDPKLMYETIASFVSAARRAKKTDRKSGEKS